MGPLTNYTMSPYNCVHCTQCRGTTLLRYEEMFSLVLVLSSQYCYRHPLTNNGYILCNLCKNDCIPCNSRLETILPCIFFHKVVEASSKLNMDLSQLYGNIQLSPKFTNYKLENKLSNLSYQLFVSY